MASNQPAIRAELGTLAAEVPRACRGGAYQHSQRGFNLRKILVANR